MCLSSSLWIKIYFSLINENGRSYFIKNDSSLNIYLDSFKEEEEEL